MDGTQDHGEAKVTMPKCGICHTNRASELVYTKWDYQIRKCPVCGLGSTGVQSAFDASSIYEAGYFTGEHIDGYANYEASEQVLRRGFRGAIDALRTKGIAHGRLLDVGCAYGYFLLEAMPHFRCSGIEVSAAAVEYCRGRGLDVDLGSLSGDYLAAHGPFDAVVMMDVIEHLETPAEAVESIAAAMSPGGALMITTGDWEAALAKLMGRRWRLMTPPQHLWFFSARNLGHLLSRVGFEIVECTRPWKRVPLGLALYQLTRRLGLPEARQRLLHRIQVPLNLFDTVRVIAKRR